MFAIVKTIQTDLTRLQHRNEATMLAAVNAWFVFTVDQIQSDLRNKFAKDITAKLTDWQFIEEQGEAIIKPATLKIMQTGGDNAYKLFQVKGAFDVLNIDAVMAADKFTAKLVGGVNEGTKAGIRKYISQGIRDGKAMPKIARELRSLVGLTVNQTESVINYRGLLEDKEKFPRLKPADIDRKVKRYADKTHRIRTEMIARTETARAQTLGYVQGLEDVGVTEWEFSISPNACEEFCVPLDGTIYPIRQKDIIPVHPRCRCAPLPVIAGDTKESKTEVQAALPKQRKKLLADLEKKPAGMEADKVRRQLRRLGHKF